MSQILEKFMESSAATDTRWYADVETQEIVGFCPSCDAELRIGMKGCAELRFPHHDGCPHSDEKRVQRLAKGMLRVLEEETDEDVALSAVAFLTAVRCVVAAEDDGVSPDVVAKCFVSVFEQRVLDVGLVGEILAARENVA
jgi:hypothetical protein